MLLLGNEDVMQVLDMRTTLEALDGSFAEMAKGDAVGMGRMAPSARNEAVAAAVYERARAKGLGHSIPDDWFLQGVRD